MNKYECHAYLYSAWSALIVPTFLTTYAIWVQITHGNDAWLAFLKFVSILLPMAVIYAAIGFYIRELFRYVSKKVFQFKLFRKDETKMPTTQFLLWHDTKLPQEIKRLVRERVLQDYNYQMFTDRKEKENEYEARLNIVGAVGLIRQSLRQNSILEQSNYRYGFQRNLLGGLVCVAILILFIQIFALIVGIGMSTELMIGLLIVLLQGALAFLQLRETAEEYAKTLFEVYASNKEKNS